MENDSINDVSILDYSFEENKLDLYCMCIKKKPEELKIYHIKRNVITLERNTGEKFYETKLSINKRKDCQT